MPKRDFSFQANLSGAIPPQVITSLVAGDPLEAAKALRAILNDIAAIIVIREGPRGQTEARNRIKNLANVFIIAGDRQLDSLAEQLRAWAEEEPLGCTDVITQVAEADELAKNWLNAIAKASKGEEKP